MKNHINGAPMLGQTVASTPTNGANDTFSPVGARSGIGTTVSSGPALGKIGSTPEKVTSQIPKATGGRNPIGATRSSKKS
jgi:hypothetical protein